MAASFKIFLKSACCRRKTCATESSSWQSSHLLGSSLGRFQDAQVLFWNTPTSFPLPVSLQREAVLCGWLFCFLSFFFFPPPQPEPWHNFWLSYVAIWLQTVPCTVVGTCRHLLLGRNREVCMVVGMQCGRLWSAPGSHVWCPSWGSFP